MSNDNKSNPPKDLQTDEYFKEGHFYMAYKKLFTASRWVDPETGEEIKLTHNLKAIYTHKMDQYKSFSKKGQLYHESHQTVADKLGISLKTVEEKAIPLLKRMGLIYIKRINTRKYITTMYELKDINGYLINKKLGKHMKNNKSNYKSMTHEEYKRVEKNKKNLDKIKDNMTEDYVILTKDELQRLITKRKESE